MFHYLKDPDAIYAQSFATIRAEMNLDMLPPAIVPVAVRLAHACGMTDLALDLRWSPDEPVQRARQALASNAPIICDVKMTQEGIMRHRLRQKNEVICAIGEADVAVLSKQKQTTRAAAAMDYLRPYLTGAVVVIGNAPTALFRLMELIAVDHIRPAVILAFPVGFVGAVESKEALHHGNFPVPYLTLLGRRGGSAMAAAAMNAILLEDVQ